MPSTVIKSSSSYSRSVIMSPHSCFPCHWKVAPPSVAWIIKLDHGHLIHNDEVITRQLARQLVDTSHVAIVCVLGERESGKSVILDALIRHLVGKDVPTFSKPDGLPVHRTDDLNIVTSVLIMTHPSSADVGVLFVDVRSRTPSSLSYLQLMKIANKFATIKLISHYKRLSPELSQMAAEGDFIHIKSDDVHWNGTKILLSEDLFGKFSKVIKDAGYLEPYFRLDDRFQQSQEVLEGHQDQLMQSKPRNQNTPHYMPEPRPLSSCITNNSFPRESKCFGPHVVTKPPEYPQLHKEHKETHPHPSQRQEEHDKRAGQTSISSQHSQSVPIYEDEADEPKQQVLKRSKKPPAPSSFSSQGHHSTEAQINKELEAPQSDVGYCQSHSAPSMQGSLKSQAMAGIAKKLPTVLHPLFLEAYNMMETGSYIYAAMKLREKLKAPSLSSREIATKTRYLPPSGSPKVAQSTSRMLISTKNEIQRHPLHNARPQKQASAQNCQVLSSEYECASQAVQHAVTKFKAIVSSKLTALMTTKHQNNLLSSYATIIMKAFQSPNRGPAWKQAADKELKPRLEDCMKELRQANKNTMRRWDKALDSALRQCGQVYHAEMQRKLPSNTKVSTTELENIHLNAIGPTLNAFSVPTEVNSPTKTRWKELLHAKIEEWKSGFVYLNENTPEKLAKVTASLHKKGQASVGIHLGKSSILFAVVIQDGGRTIDYKKQLSPFICVSEQGVRIAQDNGDFNVFDILIEPTTPRNPITLQLGQDLHSITKEMAVVLYMYEAKKILDDFCGMDVLSACVAIPHRISGAAKTSIKWSLLMGGFAHVTLIPFTIAIAINLVQKQPDEMIEILSIQNSASSFYISRISIEPTSGFNAKETGWITKPTVKVVSKCLSSTMEGYLLAPPPQAIIVEEGEDSSEEISRQIRSFDYGAPQHAFYSITPWDTTMAIAKYAELKRQQLPTVGIQHRHHYDIWISGCTDRLVGRCCETRSNYIRAYPHKDTTDGDLLIKEGEDEDSAEYGPLWSYHFQVSPPSGTGRVCAFIFESDGSLGIERLDGVDARVTSTTCKFLSEWDREDLEEDVKRYLAVLAQPEIKEDLSNDRDAVEDGSVRGQLVCLIQRVRDSLEDPKFEVGPIRDLLFDRVELYRDVLANDCASERDLHKALLKLQAVTEGIL